MPLMGRVKRIGEETWKLSLSGFVEGTFSLFGEEDGDDDMIWLRFLRFIS